jgi:hypothetical protein
LTRSRRELDAARLLAGGGFEAQAVSRAYYAAFHAAEQALAAVGETRSKHAGVVSGFARILVREHGLDEELGRILRSLFERRNVADYGEEAISPADAEAAIRDAQRFVDAIEKTGS